MNPPPKKGRRPDAVRAAVYFRHKNHSIHRNCVLIFTQILCNPCIWAAPELPNVRNSRLRREKIAARGGDPDRETLSVRPAVDGKFLYIDKEGNPWRCLGYIEIATSHETPETLAMLEEAGRAFGDFQRLLSGYPAHTLHEIIPNFHNTPARFAQLLEAVKNDKAGRAG